MIPRHVTVVPAHVRKLEPKQPRRRVKVVAFRDHRHLTGQRRGQVDSHQTIHNVLWFLVRKVLLLNAHQEPMTLGIQSHISIAPLFATTALWRDRHRLLLLLITIQSNRIKPRIGIVGKDQESILDRETSTAVLVDACPAAIVG